MKTPLTKKTLRQHLLYNSWKYILLVVITLVSWNLIFTMSAYRSPAEKIVDLYIYGSPDTTKLESYWTDLHKAEFPEMEQMTVLTIVDDETYGSMIMMARIAAGEGDIYILPKSTFSSYAENGYLRSLDDAAETLSWTEAYGMNLERGMHRSSETGERHLYGIPVSLLPGLQDLVDFGTGEYVACIMVNNGNDENVLHAFACLVRDTGVPAEAVATATDIE